MNSAATLLPQFDFKMSRATPDQVMGQHDAVAQHHELLSVLQGVPQIAFVINASRQLVYGNSVLLEKLGMANIEEALGARPGDFLNCVEAAESGSCGDGDGCRYCGAVNAILESQTRQQRVTREARVTVQSGGKLIPLDLSVTVTPIALGSQLLSLVFITDISAQKRRDYLEKIFFHDLMNSISGLKMMTDLLSLKTIPDHLHEEIDDIHSHIKLITEDVSGHQMLLKAEQGHIELDITAAALDHLVKESLHSVGSLVSMNEIVIAYETPSAPLRMKTDQRLARRVVVNALKNAIEASRPGEQVTVRTGRDPQGQGCVITIHNPGVIPEDVQHQIFQRSFSTKGAERGLGTYSMRLLLEGYLGGKVSFATSAEAGTLFSLTFPEVLT